MKNTQEGLALLRKPFEEHQISYLPKGNVKLAYVGHAALTDRLLDADPEWNWEFAMTNQDGTPIIDKEGGFWIRLTVCGVTRLGYGDAQGKTGGNAMKERIGDALRNAAMRFGAALDLWHKGDLHKEEEQPPAPIPEPVVIDFISAIEQASTLDDLKKEYISAFKAAEAANDPVARSKFDKAKDSRKAKLEGVAA